jgi:ribonuclease HI
MSGAPPVLVDARDIVVVHVDGSCRPNPGRGGWAAILSAGDSVREISGNMENSTNQRAEITAAIEALRVLARPCVVEIVSDSTYLVFIASGAWKPKANLDLWRDLFEEAARHATTWRWCEGHTGDPGNERAHVLAKQAARFDDAERSAPYVA